MKQLIKNIKYLINNDIEPRKFDLSGIELSIWKLENPPKFKIGDKITVKQSVEPLEHPENGRISNFELLDRVEWNGLFHYNYRAYKYEVVIGCKQPKVVKKSEDQLKLRQ